MTLVSASRLRVLANAASSPRGVALGTGGYIAAAVALFGALGLSVGWVTAALSGAALLAGATVPGSTLVRLLLPRSGVFHYAVLGTTLGLMLWAIGGFLSHVSGLFAVRWIPSAAAVLLFVVLRIARRIPAREVARPVALVGVVGALVGLVAMVPALRTALATQPTAWAGWVSLYADLPFQSAIAGEVASHVPDQVAWVAGTPLSYTWAFHSAMGLWSSLSSATAADIVMQAWPVLFSALMPGLIAIVAWEISRSGWVAGAAPVIFVLAHGVLVAPASFAQVPLFTVSPTRDFGHLAMLVVILCLARTMGRRSVRAVSVRWLVALGLAALVATTAKGSELPILLGGVLTALFILLVSRRAALSDLLAAASFGVGAAVGFAIAIPDTQSAQSLGWGPLTFLSSALDNRVIVSLVILILLASAIVGFWVLLGRSVSWVLSSLLSGTMLAGLLGVALLTQPGASQNYFWQGAEPLVSIAIAWSGVVLTRKYGARVLIVALGMLVISNLAAALTSNPVYVALGVAVLAALGASIVLWRIRAPRRAVDAVVITLVLTQAAQLVGVFPGMVASAASTADDESATHSSQLAAFNFIRIHSDPDDVIATNTHCLIGSIADGDCDPRRFILAAMTQRRVLVEGWGYTQSGNSEDWVADRLELGDEFIAHPSAEEAKELRDLGVRYIYIDLRLARPADFQGLATLAFDSEWARVYRIGE